MKKLWAVGLFMALALAATAKGPNRERQITMLDHLVEVNRLICKNLDRCQPGRGDFHSCWEELNRYSKANKQNKKEKVYQHKSKACQVKMKKTNCQSDVLGESIKGPCALQALRKK